MLFLFIIPNVYSFGFDERKYGFGDEASTFKNTTGSVNNSLYWDGHSWSEVSPWLYNQTINSEFYYNFSEIDEAKFWYNMSVPYDDFNYNQTIASGWNWSGDNLFTGDLGDMVGIGTKTPTSTLDINGINTGITANFGVAGTGSGNVEVALYRNAAGAPATIGQINFYAKDSDSNLENYAKIVGSITTHTEGSEDGKLSFYTTKDGAITEQITINENGYLGIKDTTPDSMLSVRGNATFDGDVGIGTTAPTYKLSIGSTDASDQIGIYHDNTDAHF